MGTWTDDSSKKTMLIKKDINGKYKVWGFWKLTPIDGETLLVTYPYTIEGGPCGIEFDDIEYIDDITDYRNKLAGQPESSKLEYGRG